MSFNIKIPFVVASHAPKRAGTAWLKDKNKAGAFGFDSSDASRFKVNQAGTIKTVATLSDAPVASGGTTRVLTAAGSGSENLFDSAAGITYTLPAPVVGLEFRFLWTTLQTSSAHVVVTNAGTVFLAGCIQMFSGEAVTPSSTLGPFQFAGNGSTHLRTTTNGTTTGGGIGSFLRFKCVSATIWIVTGIIKSPSGNLATPFSV